MTIIIPYDEIIDGKRVEMVNKLLSNVWGTLVDSSDKQEVRMTPRDYNNARICLTTIDKYVRR
jgi:hypothetical protein